jgi:hypothetical protein
VKLRCIIFGHDWRYVPLRYRLAGSTRTINRLLCDRCGRTHRQ